MELELSGENVAQTTSYGLLNRFLDYGYQEGVCSICISEGQTVLDVKKPDQRQTLVAQYMIKCYRVVRAQDTHEMYEQPADNYFRMQHPYLWVPVNKQVMIERIAKMFVEVWGAGKPKDYEDTYKAMTYLPAETVETTNNGWIEVSRNLYWNTNDSELINTEELRHDKNNPIRCFSRLYASSREVKNTVIVDTTSEIEYWEEGYGLKTASFDEYLSDVYRNILSEMRETGEFPASEYPVPNQDPNDLKAHPLSFVADWMCDKRWNLDKAKYLDLLKVYSLMFYKNKPLGTAIFVGTKRNGKSVAGGLIKTIAGVDYSAEVSLDKLGEKHHVGALINARVNVSDEDGAALDDRQKNYFKIAADHGEVVAEKMASNEPFRYSANFVTYVNMNSIPDWGKGSTAEACISRSIVINFLHDFSSSDASTVDFAKENFTPRAIAHLTGTLLAIASYYSDPEHPLVYSEKVTAARNMLSEESGNVTEYFESFERHFDGFATWSILVDDYRNWCANRGYEAGDKGALKLVFQAYYPEKHIYYNEAQSDRAYVLAKPENASSVLRILKDCIPFPVRSISTTYGEFIEGGSSVVEWLDGAEENDKNVGRENLGLNFDKE